MALSIGMAKPATCSDPEDAAVSMPTTSFSASTRGPPESPETMGASVWMRSVSVSPAAVPSDWVVMVCPSAVTWPLAAVSVPVPPALPTPVTASPTCAPSLSSLAGVRLDAPSSFSTATSFVASVPTTFPT
jgi:hypothetical protein